MLKRGFVRGWPSYGLAETGGCTWIVDDSFVYAEEGICTGLAELWLGGEWRLHLDLLPIASCMLKRGLYGAGRAMAWRRVAAAPGFIASANPHK